MARDEKEYLWFALDQMCTAVQRAATAASHAQFTAVPNKEPKENLWITVMNREAMAGKALLPTAK